MIDLTSEFGKQVNRRLQDEEVIWLTTVTPAGMAQPNPVWFYWDGESIILCSQPGSYRIRNIQHNPKVTLNLQGVDAMGNNVVVIQAKAQHYKMYQKSHPGYEKKYTKFFAWNEPDLRTAGCRILR